MYRITRVLNHNTLIAVHAENHFEYMLVGKGIGFNRKVSERIEAGPGVRVYSLKECTERGDARELVRSVAPIFLEIASEVLEEAEKTFGKIDTNILFPLADHIAYAVSRIQNGEQISNPLTNDIRVLFHMEFNTARCIRPILRNRLGILIDDDEVGYIALHIHSAIEDEKVSEAMQTARAVRECIGLVEKESGRRIDVKSLSYNRLMNHIRYMVTRLQTGEELKLNMNDYMSVKFPREFEMAAAACEQIGHILKCTLPEAEIGYLAMHIGRVLSGELDG